MDPFKKPPYQRTNFAKISHTKALLKGQKGLKDLKNEGGRKLQQQLKGQITAITIIMTIMKMKFLIRSRLNKMLDLIKIWGFLSPF